MNPNEGRSLRKWREEKRLERADLGALLNVSAATVANWELGRNKPRGAALERLQKMQSGETSLIPLTSQEERLLDEIVARGGFASREDFLAQTLLEKIKSPTPAPKPSNGGGPGGGGGKSGAGTGTAAGPATKAPAKGKGKTKGGKTRD